MTFNLNDETLVAYVDGQLDARETARVEATLAESAGARETVRQLREGAALLRAAFNEPMSEPMPERVLETIDKAANKAVAARASRQCNRASRWMSGLSPWQMALAASIAALMVGLGAGFFVSDYRVERRLAALEAVVEADRQARNDALVAALEKNVSGETVAWENPDSGRRGSITPVRTFKTTRGQWCREYAADEWLGDKQELRRAIACREAEGLWKTRVVLVGDV
ncbi:MAG: RT0821/Lpp0805 family surface protein [Rhodospirillales bacterium]|nr:RT0821/Lpp0805 family surface protein [Rhodospirillales bacterium]